MKKEILKIILIFSLLFFAVFESFNYFGKDDIEDYKMSYTRFLNIVRNDGVFKVRLEKNTAHVLAKTGEEFIVDIPDHDTDLINDLYNHKVDIVVAPPEKRSVLFELLLGSIPVLLLIGFMYYMYKKQNTGRMGTIGGSKAKLLEKDEHNEITFADVAGCDEAKEELKEIIDFLKSPEKFEKLGGRVPRGVLLTGDPGCGKTLLAKAVAHEADVPFYYCSGSDFVEMFVGVGSSRVRDMFVELKKNKSAILFIDEIDAVGKSRSNGYASHDERDQTLNSLLVEMDGFDTKSRIIVIAATNRPDILDKALLRPGRFDRQIPVTPPDLNGRKQILEVHIKGIPLSDDVDLMNIARGTSGFSGAELANLINEAAIFASRDDSHVVSMKHFEKAKDKILMGFERKSLSMDEEEKLLTAYHEAGHAVVGYIVEGHDPVYKVSIVPRGRALGITMFLPEKDSVSVSKKKLEGQISTLYGGRIAEEIFAGEDYITTGASNDIERATLIATKMVTEWGMGTGLPPIKYVDEGGAFSSGSSFKSGIEEITTNVQKEIEKIIFKSYSNAEEILKTNWDKVIQISNLLMEFETIDSNQLKGIMEG